MGSPKEVIAPCNTLFKYCQSSEHEFLGIISQPAKPAGRKKKLTDPPLAQWAKEQGFLTLQPEKAKNPDFLNQLRELAPDIIVTAAYGQILSQEFLDIPTRGTINIHPSMIPEYRGASPVQTALFDGKKTTGVSILFTVKALDAGNIISQNETEIKSLETAEQLMERMFVLGGKTLEEAIDKLQDPNFSGIVQDPEKITHCHKFEKSSGTIDWNLSTDEIVHRFQAFKPWPGSYAFLGGKRILFDDIEPIQSEIDLSTRSFKYVKSEKSLIVKTSDGYLKLNRVKPEGSKVQDGSSFWNGLKLNGEGQFDA